MCDKNKRRSALSFNANGSLDIDDVLQSDPWKHIAMFDDTEAACIQNILHDFNSEFTQEKALKPSQMKKSPRSTKKSPMKSPKDSITDLFATSSNTNGTIAVAKTAVNKKTRAPRKSQTSEEIMSQEPPHDTDNIKEETEKFSKTNAEKNDIMKQTIDNDTLQNIMNITNVIDEIMQTSTPKKKTPKVPKNTTKKEGSTAKNKTPKAKDSEDKPKRDVQRKEKQKTSKRNAKGKQGEDNANMHGEEKKVNGKLKDNLESNNQGCATLSNQLEKKCKVTENNDPVKKNAKSKKGKNAPDQLKGKQKKENPVKKPQKCAQSNKSPQTTNKKTTKCKKLTESCAKDCGNQCCSKVQIDKVKKKYKKSLTVAKIVENPSRRLSAGKQKMEIQINLEVNESSDTDESSYSSYSSDYCSCCSCTSTCSCSCCETDYTLNSSDSLK